MRHARICFVGSATYASDASTSRSYGNLAKYSLAPGVYVALLSRNAGSHGTPVVDEVLLGPSDSNRGGFQNASDWKGIPARPLRM